MRTNRVQLLLTMGFLSVSSVLGWTQTTARTPRIDFATYLSGSADTEIQGVAVDKSDNIYVTGGTKAADFPTTAGAYRRTPVTCPPQSENCSDFTTFIAKFKRDGGDLIFSTFVEEKVPVGIAIDTSGNVYVAGRQNAVQGTAGSWSTSCPDPLLGCPWALKLDATGSSKIYSTLLSKSSLNAFLNPDVLAVNATGQLYVAGITDAGRYTTPGAYKSNGVGGPMVMKFSADGKQLLYATYVSSSGTSSRQTVNAIGVDRNDHAIITGATEDPFPTTSTAYQRTLKGPADVFISKLSSDGTNLLASTLLGGAANREEAFGITVDSSGNVYVTGFTWSSDFPTTTGAFDRSFSSQTCGTDPGFPCGDGFVAKLPPSFSKLTFSTFLGGNGADNPQAIAIDAVGHPYVVGVTTSTNYPLVKATKSTPANFFISKLNTNGTGLLFSSYYGGGNAYYYNAKLTVDIAGNAIAAGSTAASDFPTSSDAYQPVKLSAGTAGYIVKFDIPPCTLSSTVPSVTICSPGSGQTVKSPFIVAAGATDDHAVTSMAVYLDGTRKSSMSNQSHFDTRLSAGAGTHRLTVKAWDSAGRSVSSTRSFTVN